MGRFYFIQDEWDDAINRLLKVALWIKDTRTYEDPDFNPFDFQEGIKILKALYYFMGPRERKEWLEFAPQWTDMLQSVSKSKLFDRDGVLELFIKDIWGNNIPLDIKFKIVKEAQFTGSPKRVLELALCTALGCSTVKEMLQNTHPSVFSLLKSSSGDLSLIKRVFDIFEGILLTLKVLQGQETKISHVKKYAERLCRLAHSPQVWEVYKLHHFEPPTDLAVLSMTYFRNPNFGHRQKFGSPTTLDVLFSYCSYVKDEHLRKYAEYGKTLKTRPNSNIVSFLIMSK